MAGMHAGMGRSDLCTHAGADTLGEGGGRHIWAHMHRALLVAGSVVQH